MNLRIIRCEITCRAAQKNEYYHHRVSHCGSSYSKNFQDKCKQMNKSS